MSSPYSNPSKCAHTGCTKKGKMGSRLQRKLCAEHYWRKEERDAIEREQRLKLEQEVKRRLKNILEKLVYSSRMDFVSLTEGSPISDSESEDNSVPEEEQCQTCLEDRVVMYLPCRHRYTCQRCTNRLSPRICPQCRLQIEEFRDTL